MDTYPEKIKTIVHNATRTGCLSGRSASGRAASFTCGTFIQISANFENNVIAAMRFRSNGCGYAIAVCETLCTGLEGAGLEAMGGRARELAAELVVRSLGSLPPERLHCADIAYEAFEKALAEHRSQGAAEFTGDDPLICTCFGVGESVIEQCVSANRVSDVEDVVDLCRAGGGCGSCRPLIQDIIDTLGR